MTGRCFSKYLFIVSILLVFAGPSDSWSKAPIEGYRILRAKPQDFHRALMAANKKTLLRGKLNRAIRIDGLEARPSSINFQIRIQSPLFKEYVDKKSRMRVKVIKAKSKTKLKKDKNKGGKTQAAPTLSYSVYVFVGTKDYVLLKSDVFPHPLGSMVKMSVMDSSYSLGALKILSQTVYRLQWLAPSAAEALSLQSKHSQESGK